MQEERWAVSHVLEKVKEIFGSLVPYRRDGRQDFNMCPVMVLIVISPSSWTASSSSSDWD
jgi:hypothetical protein